MKDISDQIITTMTAQQNGVLVESSIKVALGSIVPSGGDTDSVQQQLAARLQLGMDAFNQAVKASLAQVEPAAVG